MFRNYLMISLAVLLRRKFLAGVSLFGTVMTLTVLVVAAAVLDSMLNPAGAERAQSHILVVDYLCLKGKSFGGCSNPGLGFYERHIVPLKTPDKISYSTVPATATSYVDGRKIVSQVRRTDAAYWEILQFELLSGRPIAADDVREGRRVAVVNQATAESFFRGRSALGQTMAVDSDAFEIIGVVANEPETSELAFADVWVPYTAGLTAAYQEKWDADGVILLHVEREAAKPAVRAELRESLQNFVYLPDPDRFDRATAVAETSLGRVATRLVGQPADGESHVTRFVGAAIVLTLLFMLLPALNMANLNIGRILERAPEIGLRKATGASIRVLVGQFIFESILLTFIGGLLAFAITPLFLSFLNRSVFSHGELTLSLPVFFAGLLFIVIFGVLSGAYPAWRMARLEPAAALRGHVHV
jgi:putative ABC transport system permease protein